MKQLHLNILLCSIFVLWGCSKEPATEPESTTKEDPGLTLTDQDKVGLVWSEEFEGSSLNSQVWGFDLGDGTAYGIPGWGNQEEQSYTSSSKNIKVENGYLKISARKETIDNKNYTSARIKSQNKFDFKQGRLKVRAKFPQSKGTWPAIWLMGQNIDQVGWPTCGEIDLVEQNGQEKNKILGTVHWLNTADNSNAKYGTELVSSSIGDSFKEYTLLWNSSSIKMYVESVKYFEMSIDSSMPFDQPFFLLVNLAMGGSLGGTIDPSFSSDTFTIDYIRLYEN
jgi:beta-glucanase (GH16 family)